MKLRAHNRKRAIREAAVRLASRRGLDGATMRAIADEVGVTEAALYRHFPSKEALCWEAYADVVRRMLADKHQIAATPVTIRERIAEWVRVTYTYFDLDPHAFTFVLLNPPPAFADEVLSHEQGRVLVHLLTEAITKKQLREMSPMVALSHFTGLMLNVPRLIGAGVLPGPASQYVEEVSSAIWSVLAPARV
jgi:AcrR family transcriptional regulator